MSGARWSNQDRACVLVELPQCVRIADGVVQPVQVTGVLESQLDGSREPLPHDLAMRAVMNHIGPAVIFPLGAPDSRRGVLTIGRRHGRAPFPAAEAAFAASFADQAGVALELAAARAEAERLSVYQDRDRIARDLHDLVIQRLYATGMSLQGTMPMISRPEVADRVTRAVDDMDQTIKEIRGASSRCRPGTPAARLIREPASFAWSRR